MSKEIRTRRVFKKQPGLMFIPGEYLLPVSVIVGICLFIAIILISLDGERWIEYVFCTGAILIISFGSYVLVVGKDYYKFQQTLQKPKAYIKAYLKAMVSPLSSRRVSKKIKVGKKLHNTIESTCRLHCALEYQIEGRRVGAFLLREGNAYKIVFGFKLEPISPFLESVTYRSIGERLTEGLKDLPIREFPKIVARNVADCTERLAELTALQNKAPTSELKFLYAWELDRVISLTRTLRHNPKYLDFYGTYQLKNSVYQAEGWLEEQIALFLSAIKLKTSSSSKEIDSTQFSNLLYQAFERGFRNWELFIEDRIGLKMRPYTIDEMYQLEWEENNGGKPPVLNEEDLEHGSLPQVLVVRQNNIQWKVNHSTDIKTWLFQSGPPDSDRQWIKLPGAKKVMSVVAMSLLPQKTWEPGTEKIQLEYAVKGLNAVPNSRVVVQLHQTNQEAIQQRLLDLSNQAWANIRGDALVGRQNLAGSVNFEDAKQVYEDLRRDGHAIDFSWIGIVERQIQTSTKTALDKLAIATQRFTSKYSQGTVVREDGYTEQYWQESRALSWNPLLTNPDRQQREVTTVVKAFLPIMLPRSKDRAGLEFIDSVSKTPLYIEDPKHFIICGTTGAGKSVLASCGIFLRDLAEGFNVFIIDNTRADGSGSFDEFTKFNHGNYFDVTKEGHNLFETLDWNTIEGGQDKKDVYESNLKLALRGLCLSEDINLQRKTDADLILAHCLDTFWKNTEVQKRYEWAHQAGFGTTAWQEMPTFNTFLPFLSADSLPEKNVEFSELISRMNITLKAFLKSPIGRAISKPSSFRSDAKLIVFALANIKDDREALPVAIMSYSSAILRALMTGKTRFFIDEMNTLVKRSAIADLAGEVAAQGRKSNIWLGLSGQSLAAIYKCSAAEDILKNIQTYFTGKITSDGLKDFINPLTGNYDSVPEHLLRQAVSDFEIPRAEMCSRWIVSSRGEHWIGDFYPGFASFALTMNAADEMNMKIQSRELKNKYQRWANLAHNLKENSNDMPKL
ncbi:hypothetical protein C7B80_25105 [Cyanosarcina cf. burmensis CCALA 770]|nr:hypothetical protein C7B80_25105 [Cyanosarcina cf. burmensis CCALA 770]